MQKKLTKRKNFEQLLNQDADFLIKEKINWSLLKKKKILITGGTGFIGSYLIKILFRINNLKNLNLKIHCIIRNKKKLKKVFDRKYFKNFLKYFKISLYDEIDLSYKYDYIFHLASLASPKYFKKYPINIALPNLIGTFNLLKFAEKNKLKKFIFFSTTGVNGFVEDKLRPVNEETYGPLNPFLVENTYLESKRGGENLCLAWYKQKKIPIQVVRPAITFGPGIQLNDGRSFADFISNIAKNKNIILKSNGKAIRNFCYISDFISGLFHMIFKGRNGEVYNISNEKGISINKLAEKLVKKVFKIKKLKIIRKKEMSNLLRVNFKDTSVSTKKIRKTGWRMKTSIEEGMRRTLKVYE